MAVFDDLLKKLSDDDVLLSEDDQSIQKATEDLASANRKLIEANTKKTDDTATRKADDDAIAAEINSGGPRFIGPKEDGSIDVYLMTGDGMGYHIINVKPSSGPISIPVNTSPVVASKPSPFRVS